MSKILDFYNGVNKEGLTLSEVMEYDHTTMEQCHNYIQWLFPTITPSRYNPDAPIVTPADIVTFRTSGTLNFKLLESLNKILDFWGLSLQNMCGPYIIRAVNYFERKDILFNSFNHNHLRVTRVLESCSLLGLSDEALALYIFLTATERDSIPHDCIKYWAEAVVKGTGEGAVCE